MLNFLRDELRLPAQQLNSYLDAKSICTTMAFWALFKGFGLLIYILVGSRYNPPIPNAALRQRLCATGHVEKASRLDLCGKFTYLL